MLRSGSTHPVVSREAVSAGRLCGDRLNLPAASLFERLTDSGALGEAVTTVSCSCEDAALTDPMDEAMLAGLVEDLVPLLPPGDG